MKVRRFGVLLLIGVGVAPLALAGLLAVRRAERTALEAVRVGNSRVASRIASQLAAHVEAQLATLRTIAAPLAATIGLAPGQASQLLRNYRVEFPYLRSLDVVGTSCMELATSRLGSGLRARCGEPAVDEALAGRVFHGDAALGEDFAPLMTVALPLDIAGERQGAVVAEIDLVGIWPLVNSIRVGEKGSARLVARDWTLLAHGNPEERRRVFLREKDPYVAKVKSAGFSGARYPDSQGREVIALAAEVPGLGWTVVVEQPIADAFHAVAEMRRDLIVFVVGAGVLALAMGLYVGAGPVRALEAMRRHVEEVARGNLQARVPASGLEELRSLATALNDMAAALELAQRDLAAKERLSTFARVAAGLAHDLQTPIEAVRAACDAALAAPGAPCSSRLLAGAAHTHLPRLHRYVQDLRRLAREGKIPLELRRIDPLELATQVVADAAASMKWEGIAFAVTGRAEKVLADESLLTRAVGNLVANAADACLMRGPTDGKVTVEVADDPRERVIFSVSDTGVGIAADRLPDLFRLDFRSTKRASGVGLGLGVACHVASAHGGQVTAESHEGRGSTFRIELPRAAAVQGGPDGGV